MEFVKQPVELAIVAKIKAVTKISAYQHAVKRNPVGISKDAKLMSVFQISA